MNSEEFSRARANLQKTQRELGVLLGTSAKAVQSYEQGWRVIPAHVERQVFYLLSNMRGRSKSRIPCWTVRKCPAKRRKECPAWEFQSGNLCWFINGTICEGKVQRNWDEKMAICRSCDMLQRLLSK